MVRDFQQNEMIRVKHPLDKCNTMQESFLENVSEELKEFHSLMFSYGNATYLYHNLPVEPTLQDFNEWLGGLDGNIKKDMEKRGFEACKGVLSFTRYVREKRDIGLDEFVMEKMGKEDYEKYKLL